MELLASFFGSGGKLPHGYCFTWTPALLWSLVGADGVIAAAYFSIPAAILSFIRKRDDPAINGVALLFALFIFACGTTHVMDVWTIWQPDYGLQALTKVLTACVSLVTAIALWRLIPEALKVPSAPRLQAAIASLETEVIERKRAEDALRELNAEFEARVLARTAELNQARIEADQASQSKSAFLATMSHEIRTPMNGVIGMIDVLHQTGLQGHQVEMVALIRDSAFLLLDIIDDILDFSRIEAGKLSIEVAPLRFDVTVENVCAMLDHLAVTQGVGITVHVDPLIPQTVLGDDTRLRQVLINLIGNAIKFSGGRSQQGHIAVSATLVQRERQAVTVDLSVADNGIGMDHHTQERLFAPFSQADASTTRRFGGTGLGLAICGTLVRLMGGEISVRSEPNLGATFTVRLRFELPASGGDSALQVASAAPAAGPVAAAADDAAVIALIAGLRCRVVGAEQALADDIVAWLGYAGVVVERSSDLAVAVAAEHAQAGLTGRWLWLLLPGLPVPPLAELRALAPGASAGRPRFVVFGRGKRCRPRVEAVDLVTIDVDALGKMALFNTLALASGRVRPRTRDPRHGAEPAPRAVAPRRQDARRAGRLILVAEDNEINRLVILQQLKLIGLAADIAVNGREALERWRSGGGDVALLLTDLHMPEMDGYALARAIRAEEPPGQRLPIIAVTANALRDEELRCRAAGMDGYLTKPIQRLQLQAAIAEWLGAWLPAQEAVEISGGPAP